LERAAGEDSYERASEAIVPIGDPAHFPSQFEFGTDDNHNWQGRSDERIKLAVMTALHWDLAVPRDRVQVSVHRGWVTLTGRVSGDYERERAEADALMCSGVAGVSNRVICEAGNSRQRGRCHARERGHPVSSYTGSKLNQFDRFRREADVANRVSVFLNSLDSFQITRAEPSDIIADPVGVTLDCDYDCERRGAAGDPKIAQNSNQTKK